MPKLSTPFGDPADSSAASYSTDPAAGIDTLEDVLHEHLAEMIVAKDLDDSMRRVVVALASGVLRKVEAAGELGRLFGVGALMRKDLDALAAKLMAYLDGGARPRLRARVIDFVFGLNLADGVTQTQIAKEEGVTRACVSKQCVAATRKFGLPPARGMRPIHARDSYREGQLRRHAAKKEQGKS